MQSLYLICFFVFILFSGCNNLDSGSDQSSHIRTYFEMHDELASPPYDTGIAWWKHLAQSSNLVSMTEYGETDAGYPLHLVTLSSSAHSLEDISTSGKTVLLINNAIHPGEPDGVDASMLIYRDVVINPKLQSMLDSVIVICIPYYNIGGALNRNSHSRANQDGPIEYGFRGNAQNLDLNRDFIKCDSRNAKTFSKLLQELDPDMYIETHVSNGADYQYTMTYLSSQSDKLGFGMGKFQEDILITMLERYMDMQKESMVPYVNIHGSALDSSYDAFYDSPRYSTGLTSLHQIFGFITETHMLKPFNRRVEATYKYLLSSIELCVEYGKEIQQIRSKAKEQVSAANKFVLDWEKDDESYISFPFKGYEYGFKQSEVNGEQRLFYDRSKPTTKSMKFYHKMRPIIWRNVPKFYILKRGYYEVAERLKLNGVKLMALSKDTVIRVTRYKLEDFETNASPYEKHYFHSNTNFSQDTVDIKFLRGDYLIALNSDKNRFLVETLEPDGPDSYFNWNFFDAVLQQKEWYSAYVFEDKAAEILVQNPGLKAELDLILAQNPSLAEDPRFPLYWVYQHSPHYEASHNILPVFRIE